MAADDAGKIRSFRDLRAWKHAHALVIETYRMTARFPKEEMFGIVNQMRRAAVSIPSNIAEGFSRNSKKEKMQFYAIAKGSLTELESQYLISRDLGYLTHQDFKQVAEAVGELGRTLTGLTRAVSQLNPRA